MTGSFMHETLLKYVPFKGHVTLNFGIMVPKFIEIIEKYEGRQAT
jgi:hypothetical protein